MIQPTSRRTDRGVTPTADIALDPLSTTDRPFARISWGSIFGGALVALTTQVFLGLVGAAIGLATLDPTTGDSPSGASLGIGAIIWVLLSLVISLFLGGYIAGRLGGSFNGWLHGLITWSVVTMLTIWLLTTAVGRLVGAASGLAGFAASHSDKAAQVTLPPALQQQVDRLQAQGTQSAEQAAVQSQQRAQEA